MIRKKTMRWIVSTSLAAAVALVGVSVYQVEKNQQKQTKMEEQADLENDLKDEVHLGGNSTAEEDGSSHYSVVSDEEEELPSEETSSDQVVAKKNTEEKNNAGEDAEETSGTSTILPDVNFTEDTLLDWPVDGTVIMDYSMDHTVYFPTLDVYKYNPSVLFSAEIGDSVEAAANAKIIKIEDNIETGTTITTDMGNGYQAIYGQLKDVLVEQGDVVAAGTVLGYVSEPSRFYTEEGSNLYFAMTKDGESIDPILYLP